MTFGTTIQAAVRLHGLAPPLLPFSSAPTVRRPSGSASLASSAADPRRPDAFRPTSLRAGVGLFRRKVRATRQRTPRIAVTLHSSSLSETTTACGPSAYVTSSAVICNSCSGPWIADTSLSRGATARVRHFLHNIFQTLQRSHQACSQHEQLETVLHQRVHVLLCGHVSFCADSIAAFACPNASCAISPLVTARWNLTLAWSNSRPKGLDARCSAFICSTRFMRMSMRSCATCELMASSSCCFGCSKGFTCLASLCGGCHTFVAEAMYWLWLSTYLSY